MGIIYCWPKVIRGALQGCDVQRWWEGDQLVVSLGEDWSRRDGDRIVAEIVRRECSRVTALPFVVGLAGHRGWAHAKEHPAQSAAIAGGVTVAAAAGVWAVTGLHQPAGPAHTAPRPSVPAPPQQPSHGGHPPHTRSPGPARRTPGVPPASRPVMPTASASLPAASLRPSGPRSTRPTLRPHPMHSAPPTPPATSPATYRPPTPAPTTGRICIIRVNAGGVRIRVCLRR